LLQIKETKIIGRQILFYNEIDSTNVFLLANEDTIIFEDGCIVYTNFQHNSIVNALQSVTNKEFCIKWPNDIYYNNSKIAGILIQNVLKANKLDKMVIGVGLNVNQTDFAENLPNPTSLKLIIGENFDIELIIKAIALQFDMFYDKLKKDILFEINSTYDELLFNKEKWCTFKKPIKNSFELFKGKIIGIDAIGKLKIEKEDGSVELFGFKEVEFGEF